MIEIKKARFMNSSKTLMEVEVERSKTGKSRLVTLNVPDKFEKGKDAYFDKVLEKFDIDELSTNFDNAVEAQNKKQQWKAARDETEAKGRMLNQLFKKKVEFLNSKILENSTADQRRAIRKANTFEKYQMIQTEIVRLYAEENNVSFYDAVMLIDEPVVKEEDNTND